MISPELALAISLAAFEAAQPESMRLYLARIRRDPTTPRWARH